MREDLLDNVSEIVEEVIELLREIPVRNKAELKTVIEKIAEEIENIDTNEIFEELQTSDEEE